MSANQLRMLTTAMISIAWVVVVYLLTRGVNCSVHECALDELLLGVPFLLGPMAAGFLLGSRSSRRMTLVASVCSVGAAATAFIAILIVEAARASTYEGILSGSERSDLIAGTVEGMVLLPALIAMGYVLVRVGGIFRRFTLGTEHRVEQL